jgi:hypothetical protein
MKTAKWDGVLKKHQAKIAADRDALDESIAEMSELREDCDEAWHLLQDARDALSRLV